MNLLGKKKRAQFWFDERFGISGIVKFLREKKIPQHKHSLWYYTGSAIMLFRLLQDLCLFFIIIPLWQRQTKVLGV